MGLNIFVSGVDIRDHVDVSSITVEEMGSERVAICKFDVRDRTGEVSLASKDSIEIKDGDTTIFGGEIARAVGDQPGISRRWHVICHDHNILLDETAVEEASYPSGTSDSDIIADLFSTYRSDVDWITYVSTLRSTFHQALSWEGVTLREILDDLASRAAALYYIDYDQNLHWFAEGTNDAAWGLSTSPDGETSFGFGGFQRLESSAALADKFLIVGDEITGWYPAGAPPYDGSFRHGVHRSWKIENQNALEQKGESLYKKYGSPSVAYRLWTEEDGLRAGMNVQLENEIYGINDKFYIHEVLMSIIGKGGGHRRYHLELNDPAVRPDREARNRRRRTSDIEEGFHFVHDKITDTDAPAAPDPLGPGNVATGVSEDEDGKQIVWVKVTWSEVMDPDLDHYQLQIARDEHFAVEVQTRIHASDGDREETFVGLIGGATYYVRVRAVDWVGNASAWDYGAGSPYAFTAAADTTPPADPTNFSALATPASVHLRWDANVEKDLRHYELQRKVVGGAYSDLATVTLNFFVDNTCEAGQDYLYRIRAVDFSGNASGWVELTASITPGEVTGDWTDIDLIGWTHTLEFSADDHNTVSWASGEIEGPDQTFNINSGNTGNMAATTYIYLDKAVSETALQTTTSASEGAGWGKLLIAVASPVTDIDKNATFQVFGGEGTGILITADEIAADTITANEIAANTITAAQIAAGTITAQEIAANVITADEIAAETITGSEIAADAITATKIDVTQLSAISADLGAITAGTVTGGLIRTSESGERVELHSTDGIQAYNSNGNKTVSILPSGAGYIGLAAQGGQIAWNTAGGVTIDGGLLVDGSILGQHIAAATITGDKIAAKTISGEKITAMGGNVIDNPDFDSGDFTGWVVLANPYIATASPKSGEYYVVSGGTGSWNTYLRTPYIPAFAGSKWTFEMWARSTVSGGSLCGVAFSWFDKNHNSVSTDFLGKTVTPGWEPIRHELTAPTDAAYCRLSLYTDTDTPSGESMVVDAFHLQRGDAGVYITDDIKMNRDGVHILGESIWTGWGSDSKSVSFYSHNEYHSLTLYGHRVKLNNVWHIAVEV